jgi:DNA-binding NtrC family response regulator
MLTIDCQKKILLIDDDTLIHEMVQYILTPLLETQIQVEIYTDITPSIRNCKPDLIIVDLRLHSSKDEATLIKLREIFPLSPIIPISGVMPLAMPTWIAQYKLEPFLSKDHLLRDLLPILRKDLG